MDRVRHAAKTVADRVPEETAAEVHTAVELLMPLAARCEEDLARFRTELSPGVEVDTGAPRADRVSLLTPHASKDLEFPVVFLVGCEDGLLLPLRRPGTEPEDAELAEERRLLFVGMTRAQRHLFVSRAAERFRQGAARSPFLADLRTGFERAGDPVARRKPRQTQLHLL